MTARFPLFDFMPYGAPELMAAARGHMARAQAVSCALMVALFAVALALVPRMVEPPVIDIPIIDHPLPILPNLEPMRPRSSRIPTVRASKSGVVVPVNVEPPVAPIEPTYPDAIGTGTGQPTDVPTTAGPQDAPIGAQPEILPSRTDFVLIDEMPKSIKEVKPIYPDIAREAGVEGTVLIHFLIGRDGHVLRAEIDRKVHVPMLDAVTLEAARQWVFKPAFTNNHPVIVWETVPFVFTLH